MAIRHPFGGGVDDWVFAEDETNHPVLQGGAVLTFWNQREGGSQYTNIAQDADGLSPIAELRTSLGGDGYRVGQIPVFYGPPDVTTMWMSADGGERVSVDCLDAGDLAGQAQQSLTTHTGGRNAHGTGLADLSDVQVGAVASRTVGSVVGWDGTQFGMLTPAQVAGAVLLNPPLSGGVYIGNVATPPPAGAANPWLQMRQPYSAADTNADGLAFYSTHSDGATPLKTWWLDGNNQERQAPSTPTRLAGRVFEAYEAAGGPSTGRFWEVSTNPTDPAAREALFGAYGTGHPTQPGWMVATRVLAGLLGVRAGGSYNGLSSVNFRGIKPTPGAPNSGTWATNDVVIDSKGAAYVCTAGGTPGIWAGGSSTSYDPALRRWFAALANRYGSIASVVVLGDSISEGTGATSVKRRWQQVLQASLRARLQPSGITGAATPYLSASPRLNPVPSDYGVTATAGVTQASYGLGLRAAAIPAGESVTFTFTGTRAKLFGTKGPSVGRYGIRLDGAAEVVVDGFNSGTIVNGQLLWDSGALTAGSHTVLVQRSSTTTANPGTVFPEGLMVYNGDESAGIRVVDAARHGTQLSTFTGSTAWYTALGAVEGKGLLIMPWGANDATAGTTAAAFRTGLETIIANARTAGFNGSFLLVEMPKRGAADAQLWADYRAQIEAVAAADSDVAVFDLRARMADNGTTEANDLGLYVDEVHYTDKGQGWIADQLAAAIIPR